MIPVVLWTVITAGMVLRIYQGDVFPTYQNDDGLFYTWAGNSILDNFYHPTSLTIFETHNPRLFWRSQYRNIQPAEQFGYRLSDLWFDHPFFATVLIALPARLMGYADFSQIPHMVVRIPAFVMGFFTLILTYLLASKIFSRRVGLVATIVLAFWPLAVFSSRQSYLENIMTPFWLLSLLMTWKSMHETRKWWYLPLIIFCDIFLAWSKIIGYLSFAVTGYWFMQKRQYRWVAITVASAVLSFLLYLGYGSWIGGSYFWQTLVNQGGRGSYVTSIFTILQSPNIYGMVEDGWWFISLIGLFWLSRSKQESSRFLVMNIVFWLVALFFFVGPQNNSPWYRYPMYPLLAMATAQLLVYWWKTRDVVVGSMIFMLGLTGYRLAHIEIGSIYLRLLLVIIMSMFFIFPKKKYIGRGAIVIILLLSILGNILAIRKYPNFVCNDHNCTTPIKIDVTRPNL